MNVSLLAVSLALRSRVFPATLSEGPRLALPPLADEAHVVPARLETPSMSVIPCSEMQPGEA